MTPCLIAVAACLERAPGLGPPRGRSSYPEHRAALLAHGRPCARPTAQRHAAPVRASIFSGSGYFKGAGAGGGVNSLVSRNSTVKSSRTPPSRSKSWVTSAASWKSFENGSAACKCPLR
jgi:hypothetical protein